MNYLHEKSPCCRGRIRRFGKRRRQCVLCQRTWRVWKKKRGRKPLRHTFLSLSSYLSGSARSSIGNRFSPSVFRARLRQTLKRFADRTPWPSVPSGKLVAVADALIQTIKSKPWTIYFILVRPLKTNQAIILPPLLRAGTENGQGGWVSVFKKIPVKVKKRILALTCDGSTTLVSLAKRENWRIQRCHFHLRWRIANYVRTGFTQDPFLSTYIADIIIAKHRNGPVGKVELYFDEHIASFRNLAKEEREFLV